MNSAAAEVVIALSKEKWRWMSSQQVDSLASLFHNDAAFVHMGATFTRAEELEVISSGRIRYRDVDIHDTSVRLFGDTAVVLNTIDLTAIVGGDEVTNPFVVTEVYVVVEGAERRRMLASMSFTRLVSK